MLFTDICTEAELINGDMVTVYFDFNYTPGFTAKGSGTSQAEEPDEPEEYEMLNIKVETIQGSLVDLSTENEEYVMACLSCEARNIYQFMAEGLREIAYEDKQDLMNVAGRLN